MSDNLQEKIDQEVQRRLAQSLKLKNDEIVDLRLLLSKCRSELIKQNSAINRFNAEPTVLAEVLAINNKVDKSSFCLNDEVVVIDSKSFYYQKTGVIVNNENVIVAEKSYINVKLTDGDVVPFSIENEEGLSQIKLSKKDDGTFVIINFENKFWQIKGVQDLDLKPGDVVKINPANKAIIGKGFELFAGPICNVVDIHEKNIEVKYKGDNILVNNSRNCTLEAGDRVVLDSGLISILKKLPQESSNKYKIKDSLDVSWDSIGGLTHAKQQLKDALEIPFQYPDHYAHYNFKPLRGILLSGAPGCGKTLLAKAAAKSIADLHGKSAIDSGYIYIKGPELLDKYVGNTEKSIRDLFERGRKHFREFGYKAILAIDEADAILPQRGTRRSSDIADTIVPMFLGEMDGIDTNQSNENPIVILLTNRSSILDPAITRDVRINHHIKIERPKEEDAASILEIHSKNVPFLENQKNNIFMLTICDIFSKSRILYRINNEHDFRFSDALSGAMLQNIVEVAKINALHRDITNKEKTGLTYEDFKLAVNSIFREQKGKNHTFDLEDFSENLGLQSDKIQIDRCFGS